VEIENVLSALSKIRLNRVDEESFIHKEIQRALTLEGIKYEHEYKLISHKRFDFWIDGIVLEVKKRKPGKLALLKQLDRYTKSEGVKAIIIVLEKSINLPKELNGKPLIVFSLNANWGVAV
jgi:hypothetical protein